MLTPRPSAAFGAPLLLLLQLLPLLLGPLLLDLVCAYQASLQELLERP